jgi:hypothetical protein
MARIQAGVNAALFRWRMVAAGKNLWIEWETMSALV